MERREDAGTLRRRLETTSDDGGDAMNERQWRKVPEVAQRWGVSRRTVERLVDRRELAVMRVGRAVRISEAELARYAKANTS